MEVHFAGRNTAVPLTVAGVPARRLPKNSGSFAVQCTKTAAVVESLPKPRALAKGRVLVLGSGFMQTLSRKSFIADRTIGAGLPAWSALLTVSRLVLLVAVRAAVRPLAVTAGGIVEAAGVALRHPRGAEENFSVTVAAHPFVSRLLGEGVGGHESFEVDEVKTPPHLTR